MFIQKGVSSIRQPLTCTRPIVGVRRAQQVDGVIGAAGIDLDTNDLLEIEQTMALQAAQRFS